jgi:hypothetical protein
MQMTSVVVPEWMNLFSLPILIAVLLTLDYLAAVWLQPTQIPKGIARNATTKEIFSWLVVYSTLGIIIGLSFASFGMSLSSAIVVEVLLFAALICLLLPKQLWLVAGICAETAFFIGEVLINYNALFAILLTIIMVVIILILAITIGPLSLIRTR